MDVVVGLDSGTTATKVVTAGVDARILGKLARFRLVFYDWLMSLHRRQKIFGRPLRLVGTSPA